jgi:ankyrin repeat protein
VLLAAKLGQNDVVKQLIKHCAMLDAEDKKGFTALHWAVEGRHERVVRTLLRGGADPNHMASDNLNPLQRAIRDGAPQNTNSTIVRHLLKRGAVADVLYDCCERRTVLHQAVKKNNEELVTLLLEHGANTSARDTAGKIAAEHSKDGDIVELLIKSSLDKGRACGRDLICAAKFFKVYLVERLIDSGVDVNSRNSLGQTALLVTQQSADEYYCGNHENIIDLLVQSGEIRIIDLLLQAGANPYMPDYNLRTPISCINFNNGSVAELYDDYSMLPNKNGPTKLHRAVAEGVLDKIEDLLYDKDHKSCINKQDDQGFTALHYAVLWRHHNQEDIVKRLIDAGADANVTDIYKCTSLHYAVGSCSESLTKLILDAGGHAGAMDHYQRTPAEIAISRMMPNLHRMLMSHTRPL